MLPINGETSPLLANIYLHYVLDEWFATEVKPRMRGPCFLVRFADDFVIGCVLPAIVRGKSLRLPYDGFWEALTPRKTYGP